MITIYKLYCKNKPELFYIGSTNNFTRRRFQHKKNTNNKVKKSYHRLLYKTIRDNGGWENFIIESIDTFDNIELQKIKEQEYINLYCPPLNINRCHL